MALAAVTAVLCILAGLAWLAWKRFKGPMYVPGAVSTAAAANPEAFDSETLLTQSNDDTWQMPSNMSVHHFAGPGPDGAEPLLCIHGGPAIPPAQPWAVASDVCALSAGSLRLHFMHQRGCGRSSRPFDKWPAANLFRGIPIVEEALGIGAQIADIERARRRLGVKKLVLVGHSFGGFIASVYAAEFPENVRAIVLIAPAAMITFPPPPHHSLFDLVRAKLRSDEHRAEFDSYLKRFLDFGALTSGTEESLAAVQNEMITHFDRAANDSGPVGLSTPAASTGGFAGYATYLSLGMEHDYSHEMRKRLCTSRFPVSIVHGTADIVPISVSEEFIGIFPAGQATLHTVEGGHFLQEGSAAPQLARIIVQTVTAAGAAA